MKAKMVSQSRRVRLSHCVIAALLAEVSVLSFACFPFGPGLRAYGAGLSQGFLNSFNWHGGGRKVNELQVFIQTDIDSSYFSGCNSTRPYIVTPRNAYNHLEPYAICNMQYTSIFPIYQHGYSKNPCIMKIMHYSYMHYDNLYCISFSSSPAFPHTLPQYPYTYFTFKS